MYKPLPDGLTIKESDVQGLDCSQPKTSTPMWC